MNNLNINNLEIEAVNANLSEDIILDLKTPVEKREGYKFNSFRVTVPRYFYRIIGYKNTEDEYYDYLYKLDRELREHGTLYLKFDKGFNNDIDFKFLDKINDIFEKSFKTSYKDTALLFSMINDQNIIEYNLKGLLPLQIKSNFKGLLDYYLSINQSVTEEEIKLIISHNLFWINQYIRELFLGFDYKTINPKILYYGQAGKEEIFFLNLLSTLGCDILYYNPKDTGNFSKIDKSNVFSKEILYSKRGELKDFPESLRERVKTTAYTAREELDKTLFTEESGFYRPWQFADYKVEAVTLKTTYEEVNIWSKEKAMFRDGWKVEAGTVFVPNIFAKISGAHKDLDKYWKEIDEVKSLKGTKFHIKLPILDVMPLEYGKFTQIFPKGKGQFFDIDKLLRAPWWKYKELRSGLQKNIAEKIKELCLNPLTICPEDVELRDKQVDIFSVLINLDLKHLELLQGFDYPLEVPKIIIFNNEHNGNISYEDSIMLTFMNSMGIDILIYNPSGYNDIETYITSGVYDIHRLEDVAFNLKFQKYIEKKGFFKNLFNLK